MKLGTILESLGHMVGTYGCYKYGQLEVLFPFTKKQ